MDGMIQNVIEVYSFEAASCEGVMLLVRVWFSAGSTGLQLYVLIWTQID